jgi:cation:H+ antiporter
VPEWRVQLAAFALSAVVSLAASVLLVSRLERVGERLGLSEALLGLVAALAADGPEITSSITAIVHGQGTVGVGIALGSNVFNLAALLGLSAIVAGRVRFHRRVLVFEGALGLWIALVALATVAGNVTPAAGLLLGLVAFVPYVALSAARPTTRLRVRLPRPWSVWLARAFAEEELELAAAIHPRRGDRRDAVVSGLAVVIVVVASAAMEQTATDLGAQAGLSAIVVGGLILAAVTSLPNAVAGVYLASRGRGAATLSTALNSNALNVIVGLLVPATILGIGGPSADRVFVVTAYVLLTAATVVLAIRGRGLGRRAGVVIVASYIVFAALLATR